MKVDAFDRKIERTQQRLNSLLLRARKLPALEKAVLGEALEELGTALEELHVSQEELHQQNEELLAISQTLAEERQRYRELFDFAPDGYVVTDPSGIILEANGAAGNLLGVSPRRLVGKPLILFIARETYNEYLKLLAGLQSGKKVKQPDLIIRKRGGATFPAAIAVSVVRESDSVRASKFPEGGPAPLRWLMRDISEQKNAEEKARAQAELLNLAHDPIIVRDLTYRIRFWNAGAERTYGWTRAQATGKVLHELLQTEFPLPLEEIVASTLREGSWQGELVQTGRDGARIFVASRWVLQKDEQGQPKGTLIINRDITERKRTEGALRSSEARFQGLLEFAPDAIVGVDEHGRITLVNDQTEKLFGYSRKELLGQTIETLVPERFRGIHVAHRADYVSAPRARSMSSGLDLYGRRKDGSEFPVEISLGPMRSDEGLLVTAIIRDITERKETEELERKLFFSDRLVSMGELAASVAHEFNNPLTAIAGFAQDLLSELKPSDRHYEPLGIIDQEARRCKRIVQDFLDLARPARAEFELIDFGDIIRKSLSVISSLQRRQNIKTVLDLQPDLPRISADRQQLNQVFLNLYLNAVQAMPNGGGLSVRAAAERGRQADGVSQAAREVVVEIADTGTGIDPANLPKIFHPFFTTKQNAGMGLGLAICNRIITAHGGRIEVESKPGQGSTFTIYLPVGREANP